MTIYTRSYNADLFKMMCDFIPENVQVERLTGYNDWQDADRFLRDVIKECQGMAVIMDEDCFAYRFDAVQNMIEHMRSHGYTHAGMPDRGVSPHRTLQWTTLNPFFNILDCPRLRELGALDKIDKPTFSDKCNTFEIFDDLYLQMWKIGKPLYLNAATTSDLLTTHLMDHTGNFFALHAWYSREWVNGQRDRITGVYQNALEWKS